MLPAFKQRIVIAIAVVIGALCWCLAKGPLTPIDASSGITLSDARAGIVPAVAVVLVAGIPAIVLGIVAAGFGNPLSATFVVAASLTVLAAAGGGSAGYLWRADLPSGFLWLAGGLVVWFVLHALVALASVNVRGLLRNFVPQLVSPSSEVTLLPARHQVLGSLAGLAVTAAAGAMLTNLLVRSTDVGQIVGGLIFGFAVAGLLARMLVSETSAAAVLLAPLVVGVGAYLWVAFSGSYGSDTSILRAWYTGQLPGVALPLPIHYASAGVVGACLGWGMGQGVNSARHQASEAA